MKFLFYRFWKVFFCAFRFKSAVFSLSLFLLLTGCASNKAVTQDILKEDDIYIRTVKWIDSSSEKIATLHNEHPWQADLNTLNGILYSVKFKYLGLLSSDEENSAFPEKERLKLLRPLAEAFAKAEPDEVVDFSFMVKKRLLYIMNRDQFTSGIMFVRDRKLNIAFRRLAFDGLENFDDAISFTSVSDPTEKAVAHEWTLITEPGMNLVSSGDAGFMSEEFYPNWIQIDLSKKWANVYKASVKKRKQKRKSVKKAVQPPKESSSVIINSPYEGGSNNEIEEERPARGTYRQYPENSDKSPRLKLLQELYMEGTITREMYEQRKKEILQGE